MRRYKPKKFTTSNKKIVISEPDDDIIKEYVCPYCERIIQARLSEGSIWCNNCSIEFLIKDTRKKPKLDSPKGRDIEPAISSIPFPSYKDVAIKREPELRRSFRVLRDSGLRITSYDVRDGAGRPIRETEED